MLGRCLVGMRMGQTTGISASVCGDQAPASKHASGAPREIERANSVVPDDCRGGAEQADTGGANHGHRGSRRDRAAEMERCRGMRLMRLEVSPASVRAHRTCHHSSRHRPRLCPVPLCHGRRIGQSWPSWHPDLLARVSFPPSTATAARLLPTSYSQVEPVSRTDSWRHEGCSAS